MGPVITDGGTLLGYDSNLYVLPKAGVGAVILTNADSGVAMLHPSQRRMTEVLYGGKLKAAQEVAVAADRIHAQLQICREQLTAPDDRAVLDNLAASYRSPEVASLQI